MDQEGKSAPGGTPDSGEARNPSPRFPTVVGIGASAGGLEALQQLLQYLPADLNMAFVVIQHMDPHYESALPELLSGKTRMPVVQVNETVRIDVNRVYIISPNTVLRIRDGSLQIEKRLPETYKPIDIFFISLAEEFRESAIGIVLSGTATDGTLGLKRIKGEGGITFAQDQTAKFDSMPRSAIAAGAVDFVFSPRQIAEELVALSRRPDRLAKADGGVPGDSRTLERLLLLVRQSRGVDFTQYKRPTIARRLDRRMLVRKAETLEEYFQLLQKEPAELDALFDDLLINVTDFFRDPDVFEAAKSVVFPWLVQNRRQPHTIRAWIPGCSTGEEVYSLAIALTEFLESQDLSCTIQMFGTDVSDRTIDAARKGIYSESSVLNVSPERLKRFFVNSDSGYQVSRAIRDMCVFSRHNVAKDPPLSRMDVISCRNLLIYFAPSLQRKVIATFSYALLPGGCLILGPSETLGSLGDQFTVLDESRKLYRRTTAAPPPLFQFSEDRTDVTAEWRTAQPPPKRDEPPQQGGPIQRYVDQIVLSRYGPSGMVVDESLRITAYRGEVADYLLTSEMQVDADLMTVLRPDLRGVVATTLERARRGDAVVVAEGPALTEGGRHAPVAITVIPLSLAGIPKHYLILVGRHTDNEPMDELLRTQAGKDSPGLSVGQENATLKQELKATREYLQSVIEELRSTNEEVQSANEELQSTNEEMQTSKEELQSSNEELHTINGELQSRNTDLAQANDDLVNLLGSMNMPIVMTGRDLRIRRFTPIAEKALRLIPTDIGRPIVDLKLRINVPDLEDVLNNVLETLQPYEREVSDNEGRSYVMRVRPYRTGDNRIDGTVFQLFDVSQIKRSLEEAKYARDYAEAIVNTIREPLAVLDAQLVIRNANRAFYRFMDTTAGSALGKTIFDVADNRFDTPVIRGAFEQLKQGSTELNDIEVEPKSRRGEARTLLINARRLRSPDQQELILMAFEDITDRKRAAEARYRRLFESARDGIVIVDAGSGELLDLNPFAEQLLEYRRNELVGRKLWEIDSMRDIPNPGGLLDQIRERGVLRFDSLKVRTKDGREIEMEVIASVYSEGERQAIQFNMRDVSERRRFERELQETQKLEGLGLLAGGIAHDFNNLLTGILGNASLALAETPPHEPMRLRLRQIVEAAESAGLLTRQMLAYAGRGRFVTTKIDVGELVREISALVTTSIPRSVELKLELAPNLPPVEGDPAQLQQVLMNLVINGAEAVGENRIGAVTVRTSLRQIGRDEAAEFFRSEPAEPGTYLQLEVVDTGSGMDEATKARIFDPFFTTKFTGRGLGLAAVQGIVRRHGGAIVVDSALGQGTTFRVLLPPSKGSASTTDSRNASVASVPAGSVALVIDDEQIVRSVAESVLTRRGMTVLLAENGRTAVELFRKHGRNISVIVLDLQMPVMGGEETLAALQEIDPHVPVILSSGFDEAEASRRFSALRPASFLQKPYTAQRLLAAVAAVLRKNKSSRSS